jgi:DnaK suppressor protein
MSRSGDQAAPSCSGKPVAAAGARASAKAAAKTGKAAPKSAAKAPVKPGAKSPLKAAAKPPTQKAPDKVAPVKAAAKKAPDKVVAKKAPVKVVAKKTPAKPPAVKAPAKAAAPQAAVKAAAPKVAPAAPAPKPALAPAPVVLAPAAPEPIIRKTRGRSGANALPAPAPVVPTHAPDAAKASYMQAHERAVAPPPPVVVIRKDPKLANNWKNKSPEQLSDEEVMAMPDSEYMNDVQLAFFRNKLNKLKQDIHNSAGETTEHLREDTVVVPDPADRATIEEEHALELRTRDRERKLLKKIEQSIARIDAGDYGYCDETGEAIGVGRLIARPTASLSLEAQQRRELRQKMFGD